MQGYVLRLAMVLEAASNALEEGVPVNRSVQASSMTQAIAVMRHLDGWKLNIIAMPQRRGEQAKEVCVLKKIVIMNKAITIYVAKLLLKYKTIENVEQIIFGTFQ